MTVQSAWLVSIRSANAQRLGAALAAAGTEVRHVQPEDVLRQQPAPWVPAPDLLLINAGLDVDLVRRLVIAITRSARRKPAVVVFVDAEFAELERHVLAGTDYIVPPYVVGQVCDRLVTSSLRQAVRTVVEDSTAADLLRYERELAIGREIQMGFLPDDLPAPDGWDLTASYRPAREVSGDFYDAFELLGGRRIALVVADVCDKGVGSALFMALIRTLLRYTAVYLDIGARSGVRTGFGLAGLREAERRRDEAVLLRAVTATNDYLMRNHMLQAYFATVFFAIVDPTSGSLVYVNCGHNAPLLRRADGAVIHLDPTGPALGLVEDPPFVPARAVVRVGDLLFIYTDGVSEARDAHGRFFGEHRITSIVCDGAVDVFDLVDCIEQELASHAGAADQSDDITMLAIHRRPAFAGAAR
ncbi:PP2C family protein-serine/threonine phosphatase [Actinoplanes sp. NPDC026623]|uniref:PP2C family protein-serine/threonine phosphatase n=1 Tax=Actinoplanes sp. NPDC026623 TaxID=3155610 RepID=UPI0033CC9808